MYLRMLGTGSALVTECYNTCFIFEEDDKYFLVDGGGGSMLLKQLKDSNINWMDIKEIFVTHKHLDHLVGILWMIRLICQYSSRNQYSGEVNIYSHEEVIDILRKLSFKLLRPQESQFIDDKIHLITLKDGDTKIINNYSVTFFDIKSSRTLQYGFSMNINGKKITCCGDEPYHECEREYVQDSDWLLHEAFCLYCEKDIFNPYEKNHSTVKDVCQLAESMNIKNLLLYHTEDKNILNRKKLYIDEGMKYFSGNLFVPDDLEVISI